MSRRKLGRSNVLTLNRHALREVQTWVAQFRTYWGADEASLQNYADGLGANQHNIEEQK